MVGRGSVHCVARGGRGSPRSRLDILRASRRRPIRVSRRALRTSRQDSLLEDFVHTFDGAGHRGAVDVGIAVLVALVLCWRRRRRILHAEVAPVASAVQPRLGFCGVSAVALFAVRGIGTEVCALRTHGFGRPHGVLHEARVLAVARDRYLISWRRPVSVNRVLGSEAAVEVDRLEFCGFVSLNNGWRGTEPR